MMGPALLRTYVWYARALTTSVTQIAHTHTHMQCALCPPGIACSLAHGASCAGSIPGARSHEPTQAQLISSNPTEPSRTKPRRR
ncbi:hypothetical protein GGS23DRAFT_548604 [Durotheca rogersii]|uniref:uncharacterized protein n=1 Tax=Durotheca rogersii TaxID=419775 RepID=UPI00221F9A73|nr:uncharacterized protein GGS23DRAFT_548604 [Durotheca rogersii]KAI5867491.1 hypothetical protein GGS23DRAFT_548604 [Durotheca rogersii]